MDSIERKKANPYNINEKEILNIVAAKGSCLSHISGDLKEAPTRNLHPGRKVKRR